MGAPSDLFLVVDMQNCRLVALNGSPTSIPDLFQGNIRSLKIQCVNPGITSLPTGSAISVPPVVQNMGSFGMRVATGDTPKGTPGVPTPFGLAVLTWDNVNQWFAGDLALNTTDVDTFLGTAAVKNAYFEINLTVAATRITILQTTFNLKAVEDELTSVAPSPADQFLTANESRNAFMPRAGAAGDVLTLVSPDGTKKVEIGISNDGNLSTNYIS